MKKIEVRFVQWVVVVLICFASACASQQKGYKPKYKKPDSSKPLPCPLKDC